jgi:hypothetical protein
MMGVGKLAVFDSCCAALGSVELSELAGCTSGVFCARAIEQGATDKIAANMRSLANFVFIVFIIEIEENRWKLPTN